MLLDQDDSSMDENIFECIDPVITCGPKYNSLTLGIRKIY